MIEEKDLIKKEFLEELKLDTQDIISEDQSREAYDLGKLLSFSLESIKNFKERNFDLYLEYKDIIHKLKWIGLPIIVEDRAVDMFQYHFSDIFKIPDFNVWEKLKIVLLGIVILDERDKFKKRLREALQKNQEKITSQRLIINNLKKDSTIANWLTDYNRTLGTGEVNKLARTDYLVNGKNIKNLGEEERRKVKTLFDLYEKLKLSSQTFEGLENEISLDEKDAVGIIKEGVFEPFKETDKQKKIWQMAEDFLRKRAGGGESKSGKKLTNLDELKQLAAQYPAGSFERKAVEEEIDRVTRNS